MKRKIILKMINVTFSINCKDTLSADRFEWTIKEKLFIIILEMVEGGTPAILNVASVILHHQMEAILKHTRELLISIFGLVEGGTPPIFWLISDYAAEAHLQPGPSSAIWQKLKKLSVNFLSFLPECQILIHKMGAPDTSSICDYCAGISFEKTISICKSLWASSLRQRKQRQEDCKY